MEGWKHIDKLLMDKAWVETLTGDNTPDETLLEKLTQRKKDPKSHSYTDQYARFFREGNTEQLERLKKQMKKAPLSLSKTYTSKIVRFSRYEEIDDFIASLNIRLETRVFEYGLNPDYTIYQLSVTAEDTKFFVEAKALNPNVAMQNAYEQLLKRIWNTLETAKS